MGEPLPEYLPQTDSTNAELKRRLPGAPHLTAVYTQCQTVGRGRLGRAWQNAPGAGLYYSILLKCPLCQPASLPLAVSLLVGRAIEEACGVRCQIKWPNDLLVGGKKLVGILCEGVGGAYVCGIGINLNQTAADFEAQGLPHAASLAAYTGHPVSESGAAALAGALSRQFAQSEAFAAFCSQGFPALRAVYKAACVNLGRQVTFEGGAGLAVDIDPAGQLVVATEAGEKQVFTGEVSVGGIYGKIL